MWGMHFLNSIVQLHYIYIETKQEPQPHIYHNHALETKVSFENLNYYILDFFALRSSTELCYLIHTQI